MIQESAEEKVQRCLWRAGAKFAAACNQSCAPVVEAFKKTLDLPASPAADILLAGAFLDLSEHVLQLSRDFVRDFFSCIALLREPRPALESVEKQLREQVRTVLRRWADTLSPGMSLVHYEASVEFRLIKQRENQINEALSEVLAAIYAGTAERADRSDDANQTVVGSPPPSTQASPPSSPEPSSSLEVTIRRAQVKDFKTRVSQSGRKINSKDIALVAGYDVRNLYKFQDGKATSSVNEAFHRAVQMTPEDFLRILGKKTSS